MKSITVTLDDETYGNANIRAAERGTAVEAIVREYLTGFAAGESRFDRLLRQEEVLRAQIENFSAGDRLPREALYDRKF